MCEEKPCCCNSSDKAEEKPVECCPEQTPECCPDAKDKCCEPKEKQPEE